MDIEKEITLLNSKTRFLYEKIIKLQNENKNLKEELDQVRLQANRNSRWVDMNTPLI